MNLWDRKHIYHIFILFDQKKKKNQENTGSIPWPSRAMVPFLALKGDLNDKLTYLKWCFRFRVFKHVFYIWCTYTLDYDLSLGFCYTERFVTKFMANKKVKLKTNILFLSLKILDSCMQLLWKETEELHLKISFITFNTWEFCLMLLLLFGFGFFSSKLYKKMRGKRENLGLRTLLNIRELDCGFIKKSHTVTFRITIILAINWKAKQRCNPFIKWKYLITF